MATTREDIRGWFQKGKKQGATHMIVVCDTYNLVDYPVFVMPGENARTEAEKHDKVMEVYSLSKNLNTQLNKHRAFHYD